MLYIPSVARRSVHHRVNILSRNQGYIAPVTPLMFGQFVPLWTFHTIPTPAAYGSMNTANKKSPLSAGEQAGTNTKKVK